MATSILGIQDHKQEPTTMEEDSSLFLKPIDFSSKTTTDQREPFDLSLGVEKSQEVKEMELLNIWKDT